MFGAAVVFVIVASFYKGRTYLQTQLTADEIATEPILHGGTPGWRGRMKYIIAAASVLSLSLINASATPQDDAFQKIAHD